MNDDATIEDLIDDGREAWKTTRSTYACSFGPISAIKASRASEPSPTEAAEDTVPLGRL